MRDPGVVVVLLVFGAPIAYAIIGRYLAHQERLEMIKRGMVPPLDRRTMRHMGRMGWNSGQNAAREPWQTGTPPPPGQVYDPYFTYGQMHAQRQLRGGVVVTAVGVALTMGLSFIDVGHLGPWLLGGMIPLFIGIAQIVLAVMSGATLGPARSGPGYDPGVGVGQPNQAAYRPDPGATAQPGPWGWRPGATVGLERPAKPPDRP